MGSGALVVGAFVDLIGGDGLRSQLLAIPAALGLTVILLRFAIKYQRLFVNDADVEVREIRLELAAEKVAHREDVAELRKQRDGCEAEMRRARLEIGQLQLQVIRLGGTVEQ